MGAVVLVVSNLSGSTTQAALALRVLGAIVAGGVAFAGTAALLGRHAKMRRRPIWVAGTTMGPPRQHP